MTPVSPAAPVTLAEIAAALGAALEGDGTLQISRAVHPSEDRKSVV